MKFNIEYGATGSYNDIEEETIECANFAEAEAYATEAAYEVCDSYGIGNGIAIEEEWQDERDEWAHISVEVVL